MDSNDRKFKEFESDKNKGKEAVRKARKTLFEGLELGKRDYDDGKLYMGNERSISYQYEKHFLRGYAVGYYAHAPYLQVKLRQRNAAGLTVTDIDV
jgi:hypothetical protein